MVFCSVRVERAHHRWDSRKPFYLLHFSILEPKELTGHSGLLVVSIAPPGALWKLNWFLRDFGYDADLLGHDEIDDKNLVGLRGVGQGQLRRRETALPRSTWMPSPLPASGSNSRANLQ